MSNVSNPADLLPLDGRFGCGPSRVDQSTLDALAATATTFMGTSHRQPRVKDMVGQLRDGVHSAFVVRPAPRM